MFVNTSSTITKATTNVKVGNDEYITLPYFVVDAFAHEPYKGNPATVVLCDKLVEHYKNLHAKAELTWSTKSTATIMNVYHKLIPIDVLKSITHEICSVEVAFVFALFPLDTKERTVKSEDINMKNDVSSMYVVRFFTKTGEMPFCGHASFAAAHILLNVLSSSTTSCNTQVKLNYSEKATINNVTPSEVQLITKGNGVVHIRKCEVQDTVANNNDNNYQNKTKSTAIPVQNKKTQTSLSMLLNAGQITITPSTVQLLARIKEVAADTINLLCSLGLVHNLPNVEKNDDTSGKSQKISDKVQIARITTELIDTIQYEAKTGNLIFILHNATSVLQARPHSHELVQALQTQKNTFTTSETVTDDKNVLYFHDKVTRITLMARPTQEERNKRFIASAHMESNRSKTTRNAKAKSLQIDVRHVDFVLRLFAPWINIQEDALSANTQCALATYWAARLHIPCGTPLTSYQGSARGQALNLIVEQKNDQNNKVRVEGTCVVIAQGTVTSPVGRSIENNNHNAHAKTNNKSKL